ncbi:probable glutamate--tRNA ligase, mitochondrial [Phlebotomus argentipes]|uniref:probable glutamate--tRNA ligase, mitochondrial n=1 Tax=Phlebotomus argentipes TaxID=94469 RepID=UPI002892FB6F|nr:probable glutamate--tRNA ligase, mitochondrial [Phlebotomus argentipes]
MMTILKSLLRGVPLQPYFRCIVRQCHSAQEVRVRFAPSPTGFLHLGGLRTALYNYLFAKVHQGKFIMRIEDTDQSRIVQGATERLLQDLQWAGLTPDESPLTSSSHGPYIQSQRLEIYHREVKKLLDNGSAYYCFCTERRLELLRKEALRVRQVPKYDNRCRHLTPGQIAEKLAAKDTFCIRFKLKEFHEAFRDMVYGDLSYNVALNEGDPVIVKSDGFPTYHFANVVDDHLMEITHVLRGVEWQVSTTKHLLLYRAFGWTPPVFGHLPLIMNADGSKLSKRQGDIQMDYYRKQGILPTALINYIIQAGGGFAINPSDRLRIYQLGDLVQKFDITRVNSHSSRLNPDNLAELNRLEVQNHVSDPQKCDLLVGELRRMIQEAYPNHRLDLSDEHIQTVLKWASNRLTSLNELVEGKLAFLWIVPQLKASELTPQILDELIEKLESENFTRDNLQSLLKDFSSKNNLTFSNFMGSLRALLSGLKEGPGVAEMMEILGKKNTIQRILVLRKKP